MRPEPLPEAAIKTLVSVALIEDHADADVTTLAVVPASLQGVARLIAREPGVLAGLDIAAATFRQLDARVRLAPRRHDGDRFDAGAILAEVDGPVRAILQAERVALNFLQRLSGVATLTRRYIDAVEGTGAVILDTRKTTPSLRDVEKYAVRCGGGTNHRRDLEAMAMIKDNHREAIARAGSTLAQAAEEVRRRSPGVPVEIEVDKLDQLEAALAARPEWVLLDNMSLDDMREAIIRTATRAKVEASGSITIETVRAVAETGVDAISVGALTHSAPALDIALDLEF